MNRKRVGESCLIAMLRQAAQIRKIDETEPQNHIIHKLPPHTASKSHVAIVELASALATNSNVFTGQQSELVPDGTVP